MMIIINWKSGMDADGEKPRDRSKSSRSAQVSLSHQAYNDKLYELTKSAGNEVERMLQTSLNLGILIFDFRRPEQESG